MVEMAPQLSPYRYGFNNPVNVTDPDGNFEYTDGYGTYSSFAAMGAVEFSGAYGGENGDCPQKPCGGGGAKVGVSLKTNPNSGIDHFDGFTNSGDSKSPALQDLSKEEIFKRDLNFLSVVTAPIDIVGVYSLTKFGLRYFLKKAAVKGGASNLPTQIHHFATNKHSVFTKQMNAIAQKYGLDLNGSWNKAAMPHLGRHPNEYHKFVLQGMERASLEAGSNQAKFLQLFDQYVKQPVLQNPNLLRKSSW
jgi:hypothetical protein